MSDNVVKFPGQRITSLGGEAGDSTGPQSRWKADLEYRSEEGGQLRTVYFEEMTELHGIIETGPHWDTLVKCVVTINRPSDDIPRMTVEQSTLI